MEMILLYGEDGHQEGRTGNGDGKFTFEQVEVQSPQPRLAGTYWQSPKAEMWKQE